MKPGKLDLPTIWRGCDWGPVLLKWKDQNGAPIDLSGLSPSASSIKVNLRPSIIDPLQGHTILQLTKEDTAHIGLGVEQWDWIWKRTSDSYRYPPFLSGSVAIKDPVTGLNGEAGPPPPPTPGGVPPAPVAIAATGVAPDQFTANWQQSASATSYQLDVALDVGFLSYLPGYQDLDVGNTLTRTVTGLTSKAQYFYRVRARNSSGTSANSNTVTVLTISSPPPPPPGGPPNDSWANQIELSPAGGGSIEGTTVNATTEPGEPVGENSVWYRWKTTGTATVVLNNGVNRISVYQGNSFANLVLIGSSTPGASLPTVTWVIPSQQGDVNYRIRIYSDTGTGPFTLSFIRL